MASGVAKVVLGHQSGIGHTDQIANFLEALVERCSGHWSEAQGMGDLEQQLGGLLQANLLAASGLGRFLKPVRVAVAQEEEQLGELLGNAGEVEHESRLPRDLHQRLHHQIHSD